jgi:hypothetical protein
MDAKWELLPEERRQQALILQGGVIAAPDPRKGIASPIADRRHVFVREEHGEIA